MYNQIAVDLRVQMRAAATELTALGYHEKLRRTLAYLKKLGESSDDQRTMNREDLTTIAKSLRKIDLALGSATDYAYPYLGPRVRFAAAQDRIQTYVRQALALL